MNSVQKLEKEKNLLAINSIRALSLDAIDKANSGHPGMSLDAAPLMYDLYYRHMKYNPKDPNWFDRDRFVLSAGHASALLYSVLHTFGYDLSEEELKKFRQLNSKTPGHPETEVTPGVDASTGPLGQGIAMSVGMALAEKHLAARFNTEKHKIIDHRTYVLCGDGCLMEGISSEACSLAGILGLGKLILIYDRNKISIEGSIDCTFTEKVSQRFESYGWQVLTIADGNDSDLINSALNFAKAETRKPSIIIANTKIGYASPLEGSEKTHGAPLGDEKTAKTKENLGLDPNAEPFKLPNEVVEHIRPILERLAKCQEHHEELFAEWKSENPELADELEDMLQGSPKAIAKFSEAVKDLKQEKAMASRTSSRDILQIAAKHVPALIGGSADLGPSNQSIMNDLSWFSKENPEGRNIHYGVREFAMAAISNGMSLHGGLLPYCSTFFVFSDYMKAGMRMSALNNMPVTYVLTHDSFYVGEDGPTHEPVEHLAGLRSMPNMKIFRPACLEECKYAWEYALKSQQPCSLVLSRQNLPVLGEFSSFDAECDFSQTLKGAYIVSETEGAEGEIIAEGAAGKATAENSLNSCSLDIIMIATGSEVSLALEAKEILKKEDKLKIRVISMPSMELFLEQDETYREKLLPQSCKKRISVEAGASMPWFRFTGLDGKNLAIDHFGASGKGNELQEHFGFKVEDLVKLARSMF